MPDTDYKGGLPVKSEIDGIDERVHVKIVDGTVSPAVNQVKVDSDNSLKILNTGHDPGGVNRIVRTSELGAITPDGVYDATNNTKPGNLGVVASSRTATPSDSTQTNRVTSITNSSTHSLDVAIHDSAGLDITPTNPLPVTIISEPSGSTDVHSPQQSLAVPAGTSVNLDYAITSSKTLALRSVMCGSSVRARYELQFSSDGVTFTRLMVKESSTAEAHLVFDLSMVSKKVTGSGSKIRIIAKNADNQAADIFALFIGTET
jgi:hypothetical protein